ncbi:hypothetical protein GCM10011396_52200 [Undibacterium terreum]|uniref:DUF4148 domain-containing protein n=2 Tax=Undibacterium terreum TaxID=1224302 RepID=A0A916V0C5_9BURK|nr:hypothetical protein GCM10011396_52200 [Undibacterium terreum]
MNAKQLIAAVALITTGSIAFAGDYQVGGEAYASFPIPSMIKTTETAKAAPAAVATSNSASKTRAEVIAELTQARAAGATVGGDTYVAEAPVAAAKATPETVKTATSK